MGIKNFKKYLLLKIINKDPNLRKKNCFVLLNNISFTKVK